MSSNIVRTIPTLCLNEHLSKLQLRDSSQMPPTPLEIDKMYGISTNTCTKNCIMRKIMINVLL